MLEFDVVKCKANEVCTPTEPETQIHGLILGYENIQLIVVRWSHSRMIFTS